MCLLERLHSQLGTAAWAHMHTQQHLYMYNRLLHSLLGSVEYTAGSLGSEFRVAGGEEEEQFLHHGADVGRRHQSQGELQSTAGGTARED